MRRCKQFILGFHPLLVGQGKGCHCRGRTTLHGASFDVLGCERNADGALLIIANEELIGIVGDAGVWPHCNYLTIFFDLYTDALGGCIAVEINNVTCLTWIAIIGDRHV